MPTARRSPRSPNLAAGVGAGWNDRPFLPPVEVGGAVLFVTNEDGSQPRKIWRTNPAAPQGAELIWSAAGSEFPLAWAKAGSALLILLKIDDTQRDLWVSGGTAAGTRLLKAGFVDAVYFDAVAPEAAYFHSAHADVSGDHY